MQHRYWSLGGTALLLILFRFAFDDPLAFLSSDRSWSGKAGYLTGWAIRPGLILYVLFAKSQRSVTISMAILLVLFLLWALL